MLGRVLDKGEICSSFYAMHGNKRGCLCPTTFQSQWCYWLPLQDCDVGVQIQYCTNRGVCNPRRLEERSAAVIFSLLMTVIYWFMIRTLGSASLDHVACASRRFSLVVSLIKTEVILQPSSRWLPFTSLLHLSLQAVLKAVDKICYLCYCKYWGWRLL